MRPFSAIALSFLLAVAGCSSVQLTDLAVTPATNVASLRGEALALVNAERRSQGASPLKLDANANAAAQAHAEDMARRGFYDQRSPEGRDVADRYRAAGGGDWDAIGENIHYCVNCGTTSAQIKAFHRDWMRSPGHRRNILRGDFENFGFGMAQAGGKIYAVQTFLRKRAPGSGGPFAGPFAGPFIAR